MTRAPRRGDYGIDAPHVPLLLLAGGLILLIGSAAAHAPLMTASGVFLLLSAASFLFTTRIGKFGLWEGLLAELGLRGDERLLDLGCGRGAVLTMAARLLPHGQATGIDLWSTTDQSGNAERTTLRNADLEGVVDRVEVRTGDMTDLPFEAATFEVVVSSLAMHNIKDAAGRRQALDEAVRVLQDGGRIVLVDIQATKEYAERLGDVGLEDVVRRGLGWRGWYGGPWMAASVVTARKPA